MLLWTQLPPLNCWIPPRSRTHVDPQKENHKPRLGARVQAPAETELETNTDIFRKRKNKNQSWIHFRRFPRVTYNRRPRVLGTDNFISPSLMNVSGQRRVPGYLTTGRIRTYQLSYTFNKAQYLSWNGEKITLILLRSVKIWICYLGPRRPCTVKK